MVTETDDKSVMETFYQDELVADLTTVGSVLRAAREKMGWSEDEIAENLHITKNYVRAIEDNHFEKLPAAVFAKGYVKSYALLVKLNPDDVMALYQAHDFQQPEPRRINPSIKIKLKKDRNLSWVLLSVMLFIALLLAVWAYTNLVRNNDNNSESENGTISIVSISQNDAFGGITRLDHVIAPAKLRQTHHLTPVGDKGSVEMPVLPV